MNAVLALPAGPPSTASIIERNNRSPESGAPEGASSEPVASSTLDAQQSAHAASAATPPQGSLLPARLVIELDQAAQRFVQTLVDGAGDTVLRRYPDEAQLAFSRGVNAYMAANARG